MGMSRLSPMIEPINFQMDRRLGMNPSYDAALCQPLH